MGKIDSENNITSDTYDPNNKIIKQVYNNSLITRYIYDSNGNLIQQINPDQYDSTKDGWINSTSPNTYSDPSVGDRYTYDSSGNILTHTDSNNKVTAYTYDGDNNIATATLPDGSVFTYDSTGEIVSEQYPNGVTNTTNYNIDGTISGVTSSNNNYSTQYGYDSNGNINQFTETFGTNVGNTTYTYDSIGNIKTISVGGVLRATYTYDTNNELIREDNAWLGESIVYGYDSNGNMLTKKIYAYTTGTVEFLVVTHTNYYNSQNQLTSVNGNAITYTNGNLETYNGWTYSWNNTLLMNASNSSFTVSYHYNYNNIRTSKTVNGVTTTYTLDSKNDVISETNGTDTIIYTYDSNYSPVYFTLNGTIYYYEKNIQGDIIGIVDSNNNEVVTYTYDAWGKLSSIGGSLASTVGVKNSLRYRGYYYDTETGMYYLQNRYYNPNLRVFISPDDPNYNNANNSINVNLYAYCNNNPVMVRDGTGHGTPVLPDLLFCLDTPKIKSVPTDVSGFISVSGWALAKSGIASISINVYAANNLLTPVMQPCQYATYIRSDVNQSQDGAAYLNSTRCGFQCNIDSRTLSNHTNYVIVVQVTAVTKTKSIPTQSCTVHIYVDNTGSTMVDQSHLDVPTSKSPSFTGSVYVAGWAISMSGVKEVKVYVDNNLIGDAVLSMYRPDVMNLHSGYPNEPFSGYSYTIASNCKFLTVGQHTIKVSYIRYDNLSWSDYVTIHCSAPAQPAPPAPTGFAYDWAKCNPCVTTAFLNKVLQICSDLGIKPEDLMTVMYNESGLDPNAGKSEHYGLIQFTSNTAAIMGMTVMQQLDQVENYYKPYKGRIGNLEDLYTVNFLPAFVGYPSNTILGEKNSNELLGLTGYTLGQIYNWNPSLDYNGNGQILKSEPAQVAIAKRDKYVPKL